MLKSGVIYFDNGATTLKPFILSQTTSDYYNNYSCNAHRGDYDLSLKVDEKYEHARYLVKEFINALKKEEIIFTSGATDSLNKIILPDGVTYISRMKGPVVEICRSQYAVPVMEDADTPLTGVTQVRSGGTQAIFLKADSSVYWSGIIRNLSDTNSEILQMAVYAVPIQFFGAQVYLRQSSEPSPYSTERVQAIRLDKPAMAAKVGDTFRLTATLTPSDTYERNIRWKSSDTSIATVDNNGVVTAKAVGVAVIRAYSNTNSTVWGQCLLSVEEQAPESVALRQAPTRRNYTTDDFVLDTSGGSLLLTYPNGQQRGVSISPDYCTGYDLTRTGEQTVTITFGGEMFTYTITVADAMIDPPPVPDKSVTDIRWEKYPDGCIGLLCGRFVAPDASIRILYADGSYVVVLLTAEMCSGMDMEKAGTQPVTVTCEGFTLQFSLTLLPRIRWENYPAVGVGVIGGSFVVPEASLRVQNEDGSTVILPLTAEMCSGYDMQKAGNQTVTVTLDGYTLSYSLKLVPRLSWVLEPKKVMLAYGAPLTVPDASFLVYQDDGSSEVVPLTPEMCAGFDPYTYGLQTVEVSYAGDVLTFFVTVGLEGVASVAIKTLPAKQCYAVFRNTWPDLAGGTLRVTFANGTEQIVPMTEAVMRYTPEWAGAHKQMNTVYLDYGGQTVSFTIWNLNYFDTPVVEAVVTKLPYKQVYTMDELWNLDFAGGIIYARTADGAEGEEDMTEFSNSRYTWNSPVDPGDYEVVIQVGIMYVSVPITVVETPNPDDPDPDDPNHDDPNDPDDPQQPQEAEDVLLWNVKPSKTLYCVGEELDVSDASFYVNRSFIAREEPDPEMFHVDMTTPGEKTVLFRWYLTTEDGVYHYGTLTYDIVVCDLTLENEVPEIEVGKCTRILATFQPRDIDGREIIWTSSDETVATVDEYGRVTSIAPGEVEITAQVKGSEAAATCTVTVTERTTARTPGDADGDGAVDLKDIVQIARYLAGGWDAVIDLINSDVNGDGEVNLKDVVILRRYLAGGWSIELQ